MGLQTFKTQHSMFIYVLIKLVKKLTRADINGFWVKKELRLWRDEDELRARNSPHNILFKQKFRRVLEDKIDYQLY